MDCDVLVIGGGLAGCTVARRLHEAGRQVTVVEPDPDAPYDRPPLTKAFLADGDLAPWPVWAPREVTWRRDAADAVDPGTRRVRLASGTDLTADVLVVATGATARVLPGRSSRVRTVRTAADARRLRALRRAGAQQFLVEGAGPLGLELASALADDGAAVTVVELTDRPMARLVGEDLAPEVAAWAAAAGVRLLLSTAVVGVADTAAGSAGPDAVEVALSDGTRQTFDVMVSAVGSVAASGLITAARHGGKECTPIVVDRSHRVLDGDGVPIAGLYALGDVAAVPGDDGVPVRLEAWTAASLQAASVVGDVLGAPTGAPAVPYFWTRQFGRMIQVAGIVPPGSTAQQVAEVPRTGGRLYRLLRSGDVVAYVAVNAQRLMAGLQTQPGPVDNWTVPTTG